MDLARAPWAAFAPTMPIIPMKIVGVRPGEKTHETLVSEEEMVRAEESRWYYDIHPVGQFIPRESAQQRPCSEYRCGTIPDRMTGGGGVILAHLLFPR